MRRQKKLLTMQKKLLLEVQHELALLDDTTGVSIEDLFSRLNINAETYMNALQISHKGPNIILKHNPKDVFINACNCDILNLWGGNVNLQYVINETATVMYVCSYMMKGEKSMGETLKRVSKECRNDDIQTETNKIKKEFLGKRVHSGYTRIIYVSAIILEHVSLPKTKAQLSQLHDDDDDEDVFATNLVDRR